MKLMMNSQRVTFVSAIFIAAFVSYGFFFFFSQQRLLKNITNTKLDGIQHYYEREEHEQTVGLNSRAEAICGTIAKLSATQLENSQAFNLLKEGLASTLEPFMDYSEIAAIEVRDKDNRAYISMWRENGTIKYRTDYLLPSDFRNEYSLQVKTPAISNGTQQGLVTVYVDQQSITLATARIRNELKSSADAEETTLRSHFQSTLFPQISVLLGAIVFILISGRIVATSYRLIEKQRHELKAFNHELEQRVETRTRQLEEQVIKVSSLNTAMEVEMGERKKAEEKYRAIFENATEGIFQTTPAGKIISANLALARILGYQTPEELMECVTDIAKDVYVDHTLRKEAWAILERQGTISQFELLANGKLNNPIWLSLSARLVRDADGNVLYCEGTMVDITERKKAEEDREELQQSLVDVSRQAGMAEVATGVLHNVGNVLNSVNVSTAVVLEKLQKSRVSRLTQAAQMLTAHEMDLGEFLTNDERGRKLPKFIVDLAEFLDGENKTICGEIQTVTKHIEHIKEIVNLQQAFAGVSSVLEPVDIREMIEDSVNIHTAMLARHDVHIAREYAEAPHVLADRHKVLQILINLINNAKSAMSSSDPKIITFKTQVTEDGKVRVIVRDTGCGITGENLKHIFTHGFTTKSDGHGFGLHSSILAAKEMNASLTVHSDGPGCGAVFTLELPIDKKEPAEL